VSIFFHRQKEIIKNSNYKKSQNRFQKKIKKNNQKPKNILISVHYHLKLQKLRRTLINIQYCTIFFSFLSKNRKKEEGVMVWINTNPFIIYILFLNLNFVRSQNTSRYLFAVETVVSHTFFGEPTSIINLVRQANTEPCPVITANTSGTRKN